MLKRSKSLEGHRSPRLTVRSLRGRRPSPWSVICQTQDQANPREVTYIPKGNEQYLNNKQDRFSVDLYVTEEQSPKMKNSNVVRSRLIILINEEINEANWMVSNSAKLDCRTKQHTQFGVSASNGSRDMARTKSWRKKRKKLKKKNNEANWMVSNSAK